MWRLLSWKVHHRLCGQKRPFSPWKWRNLLLLRKSRITRLYRMDHPLEGNKSQRIKQTTECRYTLPSLCHNYKYLPNFSPTTCNNLERNQEIWIQSIQIKTRHDLRSRRMLSRNSKTQNRSPTTRYLHAHTLGLKIGYSRSFVTGSSPPNSSSYHGNNKNGTRTVCVFGDFAVRAGGGGGFDGVA